YVFVQEYKPIPEGPSPDLAGFFDDNADEHIDKLIGIVFTQNMKSMEKYYRWLSKRYIQAFGKLHKGLVDAIFRYNSRDRKGRYIATMAGTIVGVEQVRLDMPFLKDRKPRIFHEIGSP
ncbi:MAG: hypothetical protein MUO68_18320, partial [Desulfobacteraceae bacterium]|nr:hypothetical protein [Desulfobacteraceae bacterium]